MVRLIKRLKLFFLFSLPEVSEKIEGIFLKTKLYAAFVFVCIICIAGCKQEPTKQDSELNEKLKFNNSEYRNSVADVFSSKNSILIFGNDSLQYFDTLRYFYSKRNFEPFFIKSFEVQDLIYPLLNIFAKADEHGLNPELYHYSRISKEYSYSINDSTSGKDRYASLTIAELLLSDAILKYSCHMRYGVLNPRELFPDRYFLPVPDSTQRRLFEPFGEDSIIQYLKNIQPKSERYKKLQEALFYYKNFKDTVWQIIPFPEKKIEAGQKDSSLILISGRLISLGFLDTSKIFIKDYSIFDSLLIEPLKQFQLANGLNDDGVIGKSTVEKLNTAPEEYVKKIIINLERYRWFDYSDSARIVLVNIPDFRVFIRENNKEIFNSKVCTGKKRPKNYEERFKVYKKTKRWRDKPDDWETPVMFSQFSYLILNPTWNVPPSIMREEIFTKVSKDSSYLKSKNFKVYKGNQEIDPDSLNIEELHSDHIPYRIIQDPGEYNALGKIKFMFSNPFGIYLHDTPTRIPFTYSNRAVSHGCVRVENPLPLAEYLLKKHSKWNIDYLKIEIGKKVDDKSKITEYYKKRASLRNNSAGGKTTELKLDQTTPLIIDYYTAWVDDNGIANFRDDVYGLDEIAGDNLFGKEQ